MKGRNIYSQSGLTRRNLFGMAALTGTGLAAASIGVLKAKAAAESNAAAAAADKLPPSKSLPMTWKEAPAGLARAGRRKSKP
jgi:hypothetical protein